MIYRIEVPAKLWAACGAAVSTEDSRPILQGVQLERREPTHGTACATNGRALVAGRWALENDGTRELAFPDGEIIVPFVELSAIGIRAKAMDSALVVLTSSDERGDGKAVTWHVTGMAKGRYGATVETGRTVAVREIEGPFPPWRQVVPHGDPIPAATFGFDPDVLAQACDVLGRCTLTLYGDARGMIARPAHTDGFQAFALAMPLLVADDHESGIPGWLSC